MERENKEQSQVSELCYFPKRFPTHTNNVTGKVFKNCSEDPRIVRVRACVTVSLCMFTLEHSNRKMCDVYGTSSSIGEAVDF